MLPAALALGAGLMALGAATLLADPVEGHYLVIGSPFEPGRETLLTAAQAGGAIIGAGAFDNFIIAQSQDPGFSAAALAGGAWFVLPVPEFTGCGSDRWEG